MMKYNLLLVLLINSCFISLAQKAAFFTVNSSNIQFVSNAPLEIIEAESDQLKGLIDPNKNTFAFKIPVSSFQGFNSALQMEHFNEKYMQSDIYPNATFTGKIIEEVDFSTDGEHIVRVKGKLNIHGVEQERIIRSQLKIENNSIQLNCTFTVPLDDHQIKIPRMVNQKIAEEISVTLLASFMESSK